MPKKNWKQLRNPLLGEKVLVLAERLKRRIHQKNYIKQQLKIFHILIEIKVLLLKGS